MFSNFVQDTEGVTLFSGHTVDMDLYRQSVQMLRQDRNSTDEKKVESGPKEEEVTA